jgi:hypothetical protein
MMKIERAYHWFSISCMAVAVSMVCAGYTVLEPALHTGGEWVTLLYWSVCAAHVIATVTLAYLALVSAERQLRALPVPSAVPQTPAPVRFSVPAEPPAKV